MNYNVDRYVTVTLIGTFDLAQLKEITEIVDLETTTDEEPEETVIKYDMPEGAYLIKYEFRGTVKHLIVRKAK